MNFLKCCKWAIPAVVAVALSANAAYAGPLDTAPVVRTTGSAVYVTPDPVYGLYNSYTLTNPATTLNTGYVGVNWPPLHTGLMTTDIGNFSSLSFYYGRTGLASTTNLLFYVQDTNGFYHITKPFTPSTFYFTGGGLNDYFLGLSNGGSNSVISTDFSPTIGAVPINKLAVLFAGTKTNQQINLLLWRLSGTTGTHGEANADLTYTNTPDAHFNFEFSNANN